MDEWTSLETQVCAVIAMKYGVYQVWIVRGWQHAAPGVNAWVRCMLWGVGRGLSGLVLWLGVYMGSAYSGWVSEDNQVGAYLAVFGIARTLQWAVIAWGLPPSGAQRLPSAWMVKGVLASFLTDVLLLHDETLFMLHFCVGRCFC